VIKVSRFSRVDTQEENGMGGVNPKLLKNDKK